MSAKAINEATGKNLLNNCLDGATHVNCRFATVEQSTNYDKLAQQNPWLLTEVSSVSECHSLRSLVMFDSLNVRMGEVFNRVE